MKRGRFRETVQAYTEFEGSEFVETDQDWNRRINEGNDLFAVVTACMFTHFATLTTALNDQVLNMDNESVCSPRVWLPTSVVVKNSPLRAPDGKMGPCTPSEMQAIGIYGRPVGTPERWSRESPHKIVLDRPCDGALTGAYVVGYAKPALIQEENEAGDQTEVGLPEEYHHIAAMFNASLILDPRAAGGQLDRITRMDKKAGEYMAVLLEQGKMVLRSVLGGVPIETNQEEAV